MGRDLAGPSCRVRGGTALSVSRPCCGPEGRRPCGCHGGDGGGVAGPIRGVHGGAARWGPGGSRSRERRRCAGYVSGVNGGIPSGLVQKLEHVDVVHGIVYESNIDIEQVCDITINIILAQITISIILLRLLNERKMSITNVFM